MPPGFETHSQPSHVKPIQDENDESMENVDSNQSDQLVTPTSPETERYWRNLSSDSENDNENVSIVTQDFQNPQSLLDFDSPAIPTTWADESNMGTCGECNKWHNLTEPCPIDVDEPEIDCGHCRKKHKEGDCPYAIRRQLPDLSKFDSKERKLTNNTEISQLMMTGQTASQSEKSDYTTATPVYTGTYRGTIGGKSDSDSEPEKEENKKLPSDKHTDDEEEESEEAQRLRANAEKRDLLRREKKSIKENNPRELELIQTLLRFKQTGIKPNFKVYPELEGHPSLKF